MQIYYSQQKFIKNMLLKTLIFSGLLVMFMPVHQAKAEGQLTIYCSVQYRVCERMRFLVKNIMLMRNLYVTVLVQLYLKLKQKKQNHKVIFGMEVRLNHISKLQI
jgi:hypothetical protein